VFKTEHGETEASSKKPNFVELKVTELGKNYHHSAKAKSATEPFECRSPCRTRKSRAGKAAEDKARQVLKGGCGKEQGFFAEKKPIFGEIRENQKPFLLKKGQEDMGKMRARE
jgi:hypothetical protein